MKRPTTCTPPVTPSQDELKLMLALTKPRFFMPVHGEYKHLKQALRPGSCHGCSEREYGDR